MINEPRTRPAVIINGLAAVVALAALVIGIPVFLAAAVGWPLPHGLPSINDVSDVLAGRAPFPDALWIDVLACIGWLSWARVSSAVVAETALAVRGRESAAARHGLRHGVARLVAAVVLVVTTTMHRPIAAGAITVLPRLPAITAVVSEPASDANTPAVRVTSPAVRNDDQLTWTVARHDTPWSIAERTLGDPFRWRDIFELNRDRPQPDGRAWTVPDQIDAGWILQLPRDARVAAINDTTNTVTVAAGDTLSAIAQRTLGDADRYPELFAANKEITQPDGDDLEDADLIRPGWVLKIPVGELSPEVPVLSSNGSSPTESQAEASALPAPSDTSDPPAPLPSSPTTEPAPSASSLTQMSGVDGHDTPLRNGFLDAALLAGGITTALAGVRMVTRRRRAPGAFARPTGELCVAEQKVRRAASAGEPDWLDQALRALIAQLEHVPVVDAVSVSKSGDIEVILTARIDHPPSQWQLGGDGRVLTLDSSANADQLQPIMATTPFPALGTIGVAGEREVLIDFETPRTTAIVGDGDEAPALFTAIALALATSTWADDLDLVFLDTAATQLGELERVRCCPSIDDLMANVERCAAANREALANEGLESTIAARKVTGTSWTPTIVLADARSLTDLDVARLISIAGHGVAVVVLLSSMTTGFERTLTAQCGEVRIDPAGFAVRAAARPEEVAQVAHLFVAPGPVEVIPEASEPIVASTITEKPDLAAPPEVTVRVLGPVTVEGAAAPFSRRIAEEVVVYLALHSNGSDEGRLKTALWPDCSPAPGTFNQAISRARVTLGVSDDGNHHLPHLAPDGLYRVATTVAADVTLLELRRNACNCGTTSENIEQLRESLDAIGGLPFAGTRAGYEWAYSEGIVAWAQALVSDAAHLVAMYAIDGHDPDLALRATRAGLLACPGDEILYRDQMRAHDLAGNPAGVERSMRELCAVIEADVPADAVHPETLALFEQLCPRARTLS